MSYIDKCASVFHIFVHIYMVWVLMDDKSYFASQINATASPWRRMQLSATSLFGWQRRNNLRNIDVHVF